MVEEIDMIQPVILCGGEGSRLWPLSRKMHPKQFIALYGSHSLLQETVLRHVGMDIAAPLFVCNEEHRFMVAEQIRALNVRHGGILLEPVARNTAPAIALAALYARNADHDPLLLVLPADHVIKDVAAYQQAIAQVGEEARQGSILTFGIVPTRVETGYGYIRMGQGGGNQVYPVAAFVEKPVAAVAREYLADGGYLWNSGMFLFRASRYLEELERFRPDILQACVAAMEGAKADLDFVRVGKEAFAQCPKDSIDYAVMEKTDQARVVRLDAAWSDVGSWDALWSISPKDDQGNTQKGDVLLLDTRNSLVVAEERLVTVLGMDNVVVVETKDAVLVTNLDDSQEVKTLVQALRKANRSETDWHREVYRPWGKYDSMDVAERFQVKRITVKPGARLSLQKHHHRAEHWIVVSGSANVRIGDKTLFFTENQSTFIPVGQVHSLENPGRIPLELIEVQSGTYLGEDDIVRFEDLYGRV